MSTLRASNISNLGGTDSVTPTELELLVNRDDKAYAQINKIAAQSFTSGHQNILMDEIINAKNISLASNQITFSLPGIYLINIGFRWGSGGDVWSGVNLWSSTTDIVGQSFGTGMINSADPGPAMFNMLANVQNTSVSYFLRLYRSSGTLAVATPETAAGRAFVSTIVKVS
jgi:hypothetical protein